jgi:hypothetical protein
MKARLPGTVGRPGRSARAHWPGQRRGSPSRPLHLRHRDRAHHDRDATAGLGRPGGGGTNLLKQATSGAGVTCRSITGADAVAEALPAGCTTATRTRPVLSESDTRRRPGHADSRPPIASPAPGACWVGRARLSESATAAVPDRGRRVAVRVSGWPAGMLPARGNHGSGASLRVHNPPRRLLILGLCQCTR